MNNYEPVVGLEIHVELKTKSKMFCQCFADYFGKEPNSNTCPVCLGMPGALPVPNKKAVEWTILIGKALNCTIKTKSKFDRKHYFYPDLPKGYQISQYDEPIAVNGSLEAGGKKFGITRVHLEEDTGKLLHQGDDTLVDFNRSGVPLVEIVTEPDFRNSDDVKKFLEELHAIIESLGVSDADMEKGSMRLEPNISVRKVGEKELPKYKVEVKNINSFNFVKRAIDYEVIRHSELLEDGKMPPQETRGYVEKTSSTITQRSKEEAHDYRYFPEPDIPPMVFSSSFIDSITVPMLPYQLKQEYVKRYGLSEQNATILSTNKELRAFFIDTLAVLIQEKEFYSSFCNECQKKLNETSDGVYLCDKCSEKLNPFANLVINKKILLNKDIKAAAKQAMQFLIPKKTDSKSLDIVINKVITLNQKVVTDYKSGKQNAVMFLVGQVMREMKGQADANKVREELIKGLTD